MNQITRRHLFKGAAASAVLGSGVVPLATLSQTRLRLSIATATAGGVFHPLGVGMATLLSKHSSMLEAGAELTGGSGDNMKRLHTSVSDLAITAPDVAWQASQGGLKDFPERVPVRALMGLYSGYLHIVTKDGTGIRSVSDLKGRRVAIGPAGASPEVKGARLFEAHNFSLKDLGAYERLGYPESAQALKDGKVDAFLVDAGLPVPVVADLAATAGMNIRLVPHGDAIPKLAERYPFYFKATIPKNTYQGMTEDIDAMGSAVLLAVHERMPTSVAYEITKRLMEHTSELLNAHPAAREISLQNAVRGSPIPFHSGAVRYFNERGISIPTA